MSDKLNRKPEPVLIIMAAGMGSRYGGLKQVDKVTDAGEIILDFSLYDAMMAGFQRAIFIIRREHEPMFRELLDNRAGRFMKIEYAFQDLEDLPEGFEVPEGREKPWGTCHAVMSARELVDGSFAVINADDYYGPGAFQVLYDFLDKTADDEKYRFAMVGYELANTLSESGHVARGVCTVNEAGLLTDIVERTKIMRRDAGICFTEDDGATWNSLDEGTLVSMNFWGFSRAMMDEMIKGFPAFLEKGTKENPLKAEYFLPSAVSNLMEDNKATVKVLHSSDKWYGMTYKEDKEQVRAALQSMKDKGLYPDKLW
ncbi:MAG: sugar phosphate nucleotidyltransferase [Peptostreptococcaceae bacterium]|nr:sugar phosphate nucleotidyltransferase [Peptostreptococcaceae bacterium]MDY5739456.1 sugar phosphate nucleotidyltransferase [Anaerovoracaceae bacterium]